MRAAHPNVLDQIEARCNEDLDESARKKAFSDTWTYFIRVFGKARQIAAQEQRGNTNLRINKRIWQGAKSQVELEWRTPKNVWVTILDLGILFGPISIGYGLEDPSKRWPYIVGGIVFISAVYMIKTNLDKRS